MNETENSQFVKRIAKLIRQNKELEDRVKILSGEKEELTKKIAALENLSGTAVEDNRSNAVLKFNMATVLFANIYGFSKLTGGLIDTSVIMDELDSIFIEFDSILKKYNLVKIKTIGDAYMCVGGIPTKNIINPIDVVMAAIEMESFIEQFEYDKRGSNKIWNLKIGIHTGPVTATVSGKRRIHYNIKGDTVNIASRIENVSDENDILISVMTYELVKEFFDCSYFSKLPVKYKGDFQLFKVNGIKPELSVLNERKIPNIIFRIKFQLIRFTDMQEFVLDKLEKELPDDMYYHNVKHTVDVVTEVELIGWGEGCTDEEILLLKTAGLFHDTGHTVVYKGHEEASVEIARKILPTFNYSDEQIDRICSIIMATKLPPHPNNLLEEIICDADLDYLGRSDFIPVSNSLYKEMKARNMIGSLNEWNKTQVAFISGHQYFTETAINLREINKQMQIERLQRLIADD